MKKSRLVIRWTILVIFLIGMLLLTKYMRYVYGRNFVPEAEEVVFLISREATYAEVFEQLKSEGWLKDPKGFDWVARKKSYPRLVKPGRYVLPAGMNNNQLVNTLRSGLQAPVDLTFNNIRLPEELAGKLASQLEVDSVSILQYLLDDRNYADAGFNRQTILAAFIPNTYEVYWNVGVPELFDRMFREYERFWNADRRKKAEDQDLTPLEVSIMASIVDEEALKTEEKPRIAGVYLNRLKRGMPLQADPTVRFALGDFSIQRILFVHLEIDSPYNTYKYRGLPPGPIRCPSISGIEAVLNAEEHAYLYFCVRDDFSGYHHFSRSLQEHNAYARRYQEELNKRRIWK